MKDTTRYRALAERLQREAQVAPGRYRLKLACLALAGYAVLLALMLVTLGLSLALIALLLFGDVHADPGIVYAIAVPGTIGVLLLRALWMPFGEPDGHRLAPGEAPELQAEVERLRALVGAPPLHAIVIDDALNAAAVDLPRALGLLGHRHYLVLGLPLMRLLDRDELASVIAHEFGHFGARHGAFSGWIYRVRIGWYRVLDGMARSGSVMTLALHRFYRWYVPYFNAYSFVLAREQEYEADSAAAYATSPETAASALIRLEIASRRAQRGFWEPLRERTRTQSYPPAQLHAPLVEALRRPRGCDLRRLFEIAARQTDPDDTHPTLPQRVDAIGAARALRAADVRDAADVLLGDRAADIERELDAAWRASKRQEWNAQYSAAAPERARLAELDAQATLTPQETVERARLTESLRVDFDAEPLYTRLIAEQPGHAFAHYRRGRLRLRSGDSAAGIDDLRRAIALDPGASRPILADLDDVANDPDLDAEAAAALAALRASIAPRAQALDARETVDGDDAYIPHGLDAAALSDLRATLARETRIAAAWLVRKQVAFADTQAHYVLLLDWRGSIAGEAAALRELSSALRVPGSHTVFTGSDRRALARRVRHACGEPAYRKGRH